MTRREENEQRVLVLAPIGRDAAAAAQQLQASGINALICVNADDFCQKLEQEAAAALVTEEAFLHDSSRKLERWVARQPPWSDFPFVMLTSHHTSPSAHAYRLRLLECLGNVSLLERPLNAVTLVSAIQAALRARTRQYQVRDHLLEREQTAAELENLISQRTRQLEAANHQLRQEIAERKHAEAALQQAQKMEVIGQLTGGVAHDFNNLLTAVLGNLELALRRGTDQTVRRFLEGATQAAQRGAKITSQLLAFARAQRLQTESTDLNTLVSGMGDLLFRTIGGTVRIETILEKDLWPATADPSQIEMAILNLAVNARDAMPGGGKLTIATSNVGRDGQKIPAEITPGDYVSISVRDTGTGMTEDVLRKACEPFFTTKPLGAGTGLGLSQVYGIAKQSGGGVHIESTPGQGTSVTIYLPRAAERPALGRIAAVDAPLPRHDATVLVVDDDRDVRELAVSCLESLGYRVRSAEDGRAALDLIERHQDIDILLIDIAMPDMNGLEATQHILRKRPDLPFLYMTGYVDPKQLNMSDRRILKKPFTIAELANKIEEILFPIGTNAPATNVVPIKTRGSAAT
jgi:signal transduction histidine kinase